ELVDAHGSGPCTARCGSSSLLLGTKFRPRSDESRGRGFWFWRRPPRRAPAGRLAHARIRSYQAFFISSLTSWGLDVTNRVEWLVLSRFQPIQGMLRGPIIFSFHLGISFRRSSGQGLRPDQR